VFDKFDVDKDGVLGEEDLCAMQMVAQGDRMTPEQLKYIVEHFDCDENKRYERHH